MQAFYNPYVVQIIQLIAEGYVSHGASQAQQIQLQNYRQRASTLAEQRARSLTGADSPALPAFAPSHAAPAREKRASQNHGTDDTHGAAAAGAGAGAGRGSPAKPGGLLSVALRAETRLQQLAMPKQMVGRTYKDLFTYLLDRDRLALGLYRDPGMCSAPLPYVYTCPRQTTVLAAEDRIFVLTWSGPQVKK